MNVVIGQSALARPIRRRWDGLVLITAGAALLPTALSACPANLGGLTLSMFASLGALVSITAGASKAVTHVVAYTAVSVIGFLLAICALGLAMTSFAPGGINPFWLPVGAGAAVLNKQSALEGAVNLLGLAALLIFSSGAGSQTDRARGAVGTLQALSMAGQVWLLVRAGLAGSIAVLPVGLLPLLAGMTVLLSAATVLQAWKVERPRTLVGLARVAPASLAMALVSFLVLTFSAGPAGMACDVSALIVFAAWEFLARGGEGSLHRAPFLLALGMVSLAVILVGALLAAALGPPPLSTQALSDAAHARAVWASPWLGYGPGSSGAVARLSMDRLTLPALRASPAPTSGYLLALEEGGVLTVLPMVAAIVALGWVMIDASIKRRRLTTLYRTAVSCVVFAALFAEVSPAPVTVAGAAPLVFLLGCGLGAARAPR